MMLTLYGVSFQGDENVLEIDNNDGCICCEWTKCQWIGAYLND